MPIAATTPVVIPAAASITYDDWAVLRFHSEGTGIAGNTSLNIRMRRVGKDAAGKLVEHPDVSTDFEFSVPDLHGILADEPLVGVTMQLLLAAIQHYASKLPKPVIDCPAGTLTSVCDLVGAELAAIKSGLNGA